jgi:hypothetical protein
MVVRKPRYTVLFALVALMGGTTALVVARDRPAAAEEPAKARASSTDAGPGAEVVETARATETSESESEVADRKPALERPLRTVGLGTDVIVPGLLAANGAATAEQLDGLSLEFRSVRKLAAVKDALTRGGADPAGADIAVLPLPEMVAAFEDLRALEPRIFMIVGWSRGREGLYGRGVDLLELPRRKAIKVMAEEGSAAGFLALFALDAAGVSPERVTLVHSSLEARLVARDRVKAPRKGDTARLLLTTADADHLVPLVAVVPSGLARNQRALRAWARAWQQGARQLSTDVPGSARLIASRDGAPKGVELVRRLGLIEFADLTENARRMGLAGRDPMTIDRLFVYTWRLWRQQGLLITPAPAAAPLDSSVVSSLLLESPEASPQRKVGEAHFDTRSILRVRLREPNREASRNRVALIAGAFSRSGFRISAQRSKRTTETMVAGLEARFGFDRKRFQVEPRLSSRRQAVLEVLAAP